MNWLLTQLLWFGLAAGTIAVDRRLLATPVDMSDPEHVDLRDRSATPFLLLMLVLGGIVIPFYFWYSRRSVGAVLAGVGIMVVISLVVAAFAFALALR
jgi:hypothetical protein